MVFHNIPLERLVFSSGLCHFERLVFCSMPFSTLGVLQYVISNVWCSKVCHFQNLMFSDMPFQTLGVLQCIISKAWYSTLSFLMLGVLQYAISKAWYSTLSFLMLGVLQYVISNECILLTKRHFHELLEIEAELSTEHHNMFCCKFSTKGF